MKFMRITGLGLALAMLAAGTGLAWQAKDNKKTLAALDALAKKGNGAADAKAAAADLELEAVMRAFKPPPRVASVLAPRQDSLQPIWMASKPHYPAYRRRALPSQTKPRWLNH